MTREIGWIEETVEGTETVVAGTSVTTFGLMNKYDRPHPWEDYALSPVFTEDLKEPSDLVAGMKSVKFQLKYLYQHGWPWYYALGTKTAGSPDYFSLGTLAANPIKSRSVYSRVDSDIIVAYGCKTKSFQVHMELPGVGDKPQPIWCEEELWGWGTATHAAVTATPPVATPTGLVNTGAKGFSEISVKTYSGDTLANLTQFDLEVMNVLDYHGALGSATPRGIKQLEGTTVVAHFICTLDGTANDLLSVARATFAKGATNDLVIKVLFDAGATYYHTITAHNCRIIAAKPIVNRDRVETYECFGHVMNDGTNVPLKVECNDGVNYA